MENKKEKKEMDLIYKFKLLEREMGNIKTRILLSGEDYESNPFEFMLDSIEDPKVEKVIKRYIIANISEIKEIKRRYEEVVRIMNLIIFSIETKSGGYVLNEDSLEFVEYYLSN